MLKPIDMLATISHAIYWANASPGRAIYSMKYEPAHEGIVSPFWVQICEGGESQYLESPKDVIDIPAAVKARKFAELARLQAELGVGDE